MLITAIIIIILVYLILSSINIEEELEFEDPWGDDMEEEIIANPEEYEEAEEGGSSSMQLDQLEDEEEKEDAPKKAGYVCFRFRFENSDFFFSLTQGLASRNESLSWRNIRARSIDLRYAS